MTDLEDAQNRADGTDAPESSKPPPGVHVAATPIGNLRDVTLRLLDLLRSADRIACEDTRAAKALMTAHGIAAGGRLTSLHGHNEAAAAPALAAAAAAGEAVLLLSEAGTPGVSDPGARLVAAAREAGAPVHAVPGACAAIAALSVAALPMDRFFFAGFPPRKPGARGRFFAEIGAIPATLVLYESPQRIADLLAAAAEALGPRDAALARELTKRFEEVRRGTLSELAEGCLKDPPRGEIVLLIAPPEAQAGLDDAALDALLQENLHLGVRAAADRAAEAGVPRRTAYQRALALKDGG